MPLSANSQRLVDELEKLPLLDNRFEQIKLVNFNTVSGEKRGCFSLVFRAYDRIDKRIVALKFYDIDPNWSYDTYRINAFKREHDILQDLIGKERCLQLESALSTYQLTIDIPGQPSLTLPCQYFAVSWIESDIDDYFFLNNDYSSIEKLKLFNEIVLAIEALHRYEVFHRDIKSDNLRAYQKALQRVVIAIDLGTAARITSGYIQNAYTHSVGAPAYAAPEAHCGLAAHRKIAPYTDKYALGCLLFELFNNDYYFRALINRNPNYSLYLHAMAIVINGAVTEDEQLKRWTTAVKQHGIRFIPIEIDSSGNNVPNAIIDILNNIMKSLTNVDFSKRPKLDWVRKQIWTAIRVLENEILFQHKVKVAKEIRLKRKQKIIEKEIRLQRYLADRGITHAAK